MRTNMKLFFAGVLLLLFIGLNQSYSQQCEPGGHWIDGCTSGGLDVMESVALVGVNFTLTNCNLPAEVSISLTGPVTVHRQGSQDIAVLPAPALPQLTVMWMLSPLKLSA